MGPSASSTEIKAAFYRRAKELHPDRIQAKTATEEFKKVTEAYRLLSDEGERRQIDRMRKQCEHMRLWGHDLTMEGWTEGLTDGETDGLTDGETDGRRHGLT